MKKLLALLTALILALSCTLALAEETLPALTITEEYHIDREAAKQLTGMFVQDANQAELVDAIVGILNSLTEKLVIADNGIQLDLALNGKNAVSLACGLTENGFAAASTLFPNYVLTLSAETVTNLLEQFAAQIGTGEDDNGAAAVIASLTEAASGYFNTFIDSCVGAVSYGEPEQGEFTFDGIEGSFNSHVPMTVDVAAVAAAMKTLSEQLANDETIQSGLETLKGMGVDVGDTSEMAITELPADDEIPTVTCDLYMTLDEQGAQSGATYVVTQVTAPGAESPATIVDVLADEGSVVVTVQLPDAQTNLGFTLEYDDQGGSFRLDVDTQGFYCGLACMLTLGDVTTLESNIYVLDDQKPLVNDIVTFAQGGERTLSLEPGTKNVLAIEDLLNDSEGQLSGGLVMDVLMSGLGGVMAVANEVLPEEMSSLMGNITGGSND